MKTYLDIPHYDHKSAVALGAKFDLALKQWYCPDGIDLMLFKRWLPSELAKWAKLPRKKYKRRKRK